MARTYENCGYEVVMLPMISVEKRAAFLLAEIAQADTKLR
jgi:predicted ATPase